MCSETLPRIHDPNLTVQTVAGGPHLPTPIAFFGTDDILVIDKNNGTVKRIINGSMSDLPLFHLMLLPRKRGMGEIAISKGPLGIYVFSYFTEVNYKMGEAPWAVGCINMSF